MSVAVSRRKLLLGSLSLLTLATPAFAQTNLLYGGESDGFVRDPSLLPPPESPVDFEITPANLKKIPGTFRKQLVEYAGSEFPGTLVVDPEHRTSTTSSKTTRPSASASASAAQVFPGVAKQKSA